MVDEFAARHSNRAWPLLIPRSTSFVLSYFRTSYFRTFPRPSATRPAEHVEAGGDAGDGAGVVVPQAEAAAGVRVVGHLQHQGAVQVRAEHASDRLEPDRLAHAGG